MKQKRFLYILILLIIYIFISAVSYTRAVTKDISDNLFRLHVIANSDSDEDQELKYIVRDKILASIGEMCKNVNTKEEIVNIAKENMDEIKKIAKNTILENGYDYSVNIDVGNFSFPTKYYGDVALPSGFYDALKIEIGQAEGNNWWCVMFPPLCFTDITSGIVPDSSKEYLKDNLSNEEYNLIAGDSADVKVKFKVVELFQNINTSLAQF